MVPQNWSLHGIQQLIDGVGVGVCQLKPRMWAWVPVELVSLGLCWDHPSGKDQDQLFPEDGAALPWALVITWPTDLNTDPGSSKATDPHMALGCSLGFNVSMALGSSSDHSDQCGPSSSMPP